MTPDWITAAGWTTSQVEVEFAHRDGPHALVVFRTRFMPSHRELAVFSLASAHRPGQWAQVAEGADITVTVGATGWTRVCVYAYGHHTARSTVTCSYRSREYQVGTDENGWWALLLDTDPAAGDDVEPRIVSLGLDVDVVPLTASAELLDGVTYIGTYRPLLDDSDQPS